MYEINIEQLWNVLIDYSNSYMPNKEDKEYGNYVNIANNLLKKNKEFIETAIFIGKHYYPFNDKEMRILLIASALHDIPGRNKLYHLYGSCNDNECPQDHGDIAYDLLYENNYKALRKIYPYLSNYDCIVISNAIKYYCKNQKKLNGIYINAFTKDIMQILISVEYMINHKK